MKNIFKKLISFFTRKSPCCDSVMTNVDEYKGSLVYECSKCSKQWF